MAASAAASTSLKEYLRKYESNTVDDKKKKKKKKSKPVANSVLVVDEDPIWQKPVKQEEGSSDESAEEKPQVDEDIEVKRMKRLEQLRSRQPYHAISEDGSGWVPISDAPKLSNSNYSNTDVSPPHKLRVRNDSLTPEPKLKCSGSESSREAADLSPPRQRRKRQDSPSPEPTLKSSEHCKGEPDFSPPRTRSRHSTLSEPQQSKEHNREGTDSTPPRQRWRDNHSPSPDHELKASEYGRDGADLSPPRRRQRRDHSLLPEPELKLSGTNKGGTDLSPPRQQCRRHHTPSETTNILNPADLNVDISPPRRPHRRRPASHARDPDMPNISSTRVRGNSPYQDDSNVSFQKDLSPPRKGRQDSRRPESFDLSPEKSYRRLTETSHVSSVSDLSPPRKSRNEASSLKELPKTGLVTGQDIKEENAKTKRDDWLRFKKMDPSLSGRGAEGVYRDKIKGERISKEEFLKLHKKEEKPKEKKLEWGKGLAQKREAEEKQLELELEKDKPFARTRDDPDLDRMLKDRLRWGDPMAHLVKKKHSELVLPDLGVGEKMKDSGFIVPQEIPSHSWIKRGLDAAPNRYGIRPGRHWDGVDRSTGFEKDMFKRMNEKQATEREAYLWSVSDM